MYRSVIQIFFKLILLFIRTQYFGATERVVLLCRNSAGLLRSEENKPSALGLYRCVYFLENIISYIVFLEKISYKEACLSNTLMLFRLRSTLIRPQMARPLGIQIIKGCLSK